MAWGFSRDDVEGAFFWRYLELGIFGISPFESIDRDGVGRLIRIAAEEGRAARPGLKLGVCGEHGGDPDSVHFFHEVGLDYVSCSPFRVPVARLEAGRAAIETDRLGQPLTTATVTRRRPHRPPPVRAAVRRRRGVTWALPRPWGTTVKGWPEMAPSTPVPGAAAGEALRCATVGRGDAEGHRPRPVPVRAGPGPGAALGGLPPARREDPGARGRHRRLPAYPADPLAGGGADRPGDGCPARLRPGSGGHRRAGPRPRAPALRAQRRGRARRARRVLRRLRGQRADAAGADPAGGQGARPGRQSRRAQPHPGRARRGQQVPVAAPPRAAQVRRVRRRPPGLRLATAERWRPAAALPGGAGDGLGRRRGVLGARRRGRHPRRLRLAAPAARRPRRAGGALRRRGRRLLRGVPGRPRRGAGRTARRSGAHPAGRVRRQPPGAGRAEGHHQRAHRPVRGDRGGGHPGALRPRPAHRYAADLVVPRRIRAQCALLKGIACGT